MTTSGPIRRAVLGLGANLGDPVAALRGAVEALIATPGVHVVACSNAYWTDPVGGPDQPRYLNAVAIVETELDGLELLGAAQAIEQSWGRVREVRWGPRTLDVDLISIDEVILESPRLTLPHPRARERAFVLIPWSQIDPEATIPGAGRIADLIETVDASGIERTDLVLLLPTGREPG